MEVLALLFILYLNLDVGSYRRSRYPSLRPRSLREEELLTATTLQKGVNGYQPE